MIDFYADWCVSCKEIEQITLRDAREQNTLASFVVVRVDVTENNETNKAIMQHLNVIAPPTFIFFDLITTEVYNSRIVGETKAPELTKHLQSLQLTPLNK